MAEGTSDITAKATVLGLGNAGTKIVKELSLISASSWLSIGAADTDKSSLGFCALPNTFPIGFEWTQGAGCGGNVLKGERAFAHPSKNIINDFIKDSSLLIVSGGLGGGTATAGCSSIARTSRKMGIPSIFIVTMPFSFEGHSKREMAEGGIKMLLPDADIVIAIPNDILYSSMPAHTSADEAFRRSDMEIARAIMGITEIIRCRNLLSADLSDFKNVLQKRKSICCIGLGTAQRSEGENFCHAALERLMASPLLGGPDKLREADAAIITLTGGPELNIGEMRHTLEAVQRYAGTDTKLIVGANTDPLYTGFVQITLVSVKYEFMPELPEEKGENTDFPEQDPSAQPELPLLPVSKGIFANTSRNIVASQDLDIPTFLRQGIHLDKGK
ncbi:MAG TPA: hypothetical protein DCZ94_00955 [Lentisphaeria bacterium]|nr:MAG: hypothetical protein A2X48_11815 [Lentisphaerae bacterium GWF2_49_21]HBC85499.1 hypothetical protein [Lentisphaeria bacterium]